MGYAMAGFEVVGVDDRPQPRFPFEFHQWDALQFPLEGFDVIHASPPCQHYSNITPHPELFPDLVGPTRERLKRAGVPYVIENVVGAPLESPLVLCGTMFAGLRVIRHRLFESNVPLSDCPHGLHPPVLSSDMRGGHRDLDPWKDFVMVVGNNVGVGPGGDAMGIGWMRRVELTQAIPPAYTAHVGRQLQAWLRGEVAPPRERTQRCSLCREFRPLGAFSKDRRRSQGIAGKCRPCKLKGDKRSDVR